MNPEKTFLKMTFLVVGLGCGCTISSSKEEYARADGKVKAELFKASKKKLELACAGGHGFGICVPEVKKRASVVLKVGTRPPTVISAWRCKDAESGAWLEVDPAGKRVAYRCGKKGKWTVVYLGARGVGFGGDATYGAGEAMDWSAVPSLKEARVKLFVGYGYVWKSKLWAQVSKDSDEAAQVEFLLATAHDEPSGFHRQRTQGGAWQEAFNGLSKEAQASLGTGLVKRAFGPGEAARDVLIIRAFVHGEPTAKHAGVLATRVEALLSARKEVVLLKSLFSGLNRLAPKRAAEFGCKIVTKLAGEAAARPKSVRRYRGLEKMALLVIAENKQPCEVVGRLVDKNLCDAASSRRRRPYKAQKGKDLSRMCLPLLPDPKPPRTTRLGKPGYSAFGTPSTSFAPKRHHVFASCALGITSADQKKRWARTWFDVRYSKELPCSTKKFSGKCPCSERVIRDAVCGLDAAKKKTTVKGCAVKVDDRKKKIVITSPGT